MKVQNRSKLEQLLKTQGGRLLGGWYALNDAWLVTEGNGQAIIDVERRINASPEALFEIMSNNESCERTLVHLGRLLHNFLASAVGLDEQTKGHVKRFYRSARLHDEFFTRHDQASQSEPLYAVVRALRNVALHYTLPTIRVKFDISGPPGGSVNDPGATEEATFHLDVMYALSLLRLAGNQRDLVHRQAIKHLEGMGEDLPLTPLTEGFLRMYRPLADWLRLKEHQVSGSEIEKFTESYNELVSRYNATFSR